MEKVKRRYEGMFYLNILLSMLSYPPATCTDQQYLVVAADVKRYLISRKLPFKDYHIDDVTLSYDYQEPLRDNYNFEIEFSSDNITEEELRSIKEGEYENIHLDWFVDNDLTKETIEQGR